MTISRLRLLALEDRLTPVQVGYEAFDSVSTPALPSGWTGTTVLGSADSWQTSATASSTYDLIPSPPNYVTTTATGASEKRLDSPVLQIPNDPSVQLRFSHAYGFIVRPRFGTPSAQVNGGVLEISINGGAFQDILSSGGSFVSGGYDGTVLPTAGNPLAGRQAWADTTYVNFNAAYTYRGTVVNLPAVALGQSVQFRWRMATDELGTWRVDNIRVGSPPSAVQIASGDGQSAHVRTTFARPIEVRVVDQDGIPLEGVNVRFTETSIPPGSISALTLLDAQGNSTQGGPTDANGLARVRVFASGYLARTASVEASIDGGLSATFQLTTTGIDNGRYVTSAFGAGPGGGPQVRAFNDDGGESYNFFAYDPAFRGGVVTTVGDVTGDQYPDIVTGTQSAGAPHVKVFDGRTGAEVRSFFAFDTGFTGGVSLATIDVNADGFADIVVGAGAGGGPHVRAFSGKDGSLLRNFFAFDPVFRGGVSVAAGNGQIVVGAGAGGGPHVKVYDVATGNVDLQFFAFPTTFSGGVNVAVGDFDNDGVTDYVAGQKSGGSAVGTFSGRTQTLTMISPFGAFAGGVSVAGRDVNRDSIPDLSIGAGRGGGPRVLTQLSDTDNVYLPPNNFPADFFAFDAGFTGGVNVG